MKDVTLVVMAAGMGSRYGGIKQLDSFGPEGEVIMDYSVFDAIKAGFNKVVIIIRKDIKADFMEIIGNRLEEKAGVPVHYVYQEMDNLPEGFKVPEGRTKPWGTGQALLAAKEYVHEPFLAINADDFYGREPYKIMHDFLANVDESDGKAHFGMAGYLLKNTLSDNGSVSRGICSVDGNGYLVSIEEHLDVEKKGEGAVGFTASGEKHELSLEDVTSMNMMGLTPKVFEALEKGFVDFLGGISSNPLKAEFFHIRVISDMIRAGKADMKVFNTDAKWFGVTYQEDKPTVKAAIEKLTKDGVYSEKLWN